MGKKRSSAEPTTERTPLKKATMADLILYSFGLRSAAELEKIFRTLPGPLGVEAARRIQVAIREKTCGTRADMEGM